MASACKIFTFYHDCMYKAIYATSRIIQLEKCFSNMRARNIIEKMSDRITREFPTQYFFSIYTLTENRKKKKKQEKKGRNKNENKKNSRNSFNYAYIVLYNCGNPIAAEGTLFLETLSFTYRFPRFNDNHFSNVSSLPDLKLTLSWLVTLSLAHRRQFHQLGYLNVCTRKIPMKITKDHGDTGGSSSVEGGREDVTIRYQTRIIVVNQHRINY